MSIMKRFYFISIAILASLVACTTQDDVYKEYVIEGGHIYPAKAVNVQYVAGYQRVTLNWEKPKDPSVINSKLFWNSRQDSVEVAYDANGKAGYTVTGLEDRSYTFYIVNYDKHGNKSLDYEITANPYGANWLISHSERSVSGRYFDEGDSTVLIFTKATYEMVSTRVAYMNKSGKVVEYPEPLLPGQDTIVLKDAMKGKKIYFKSTFKPEGGTDEVENTSWTPSSQAILHKLDVDKWTVAATTGQVQGTFAPDRIFDGLVDSGAGRYISSNASGFREIFPKILSIDTHAEAGKEPTILSLDFYQHPNDGSYRFIRDVEIYMGNTPYDPDAKNGAGDYEGFILKRTFSTSYASQTVALPRNNTGRYLALVFLNSFNRTTYFIDLWELVPFGYVEGDADIPYPDFK